MQNYLWLWILVAPPVLALIDAMTSSANTSFGRRDFSDRRNEGMPQTY